MKNSTANLLCAVWSIWFACTIALMIYAVFNQNFIALTCSIMSMGFSVIFITWFRKKGIAK